MSNISTQFLKFFTKTKEQTSALDVTNTDINIGEHFAAEENSEGWNNFGLEINSTPTNSPPTQNNTQKYTGILADFHYLENGNIDTSQFTLENLEKIFPKDKYTVEEQNIPDTNIKKTIVYDKETGKERLSIDNSNPENIFVFSFNETGKTEYFLRLNSNGDENLKERYSYNEDGTSNLISYIDGELLSTESIDTNGNRTKQIYNSNEEIIQEQYIRNGEFEPEWTQEIENNVAWKKTLANGAVEYPIVIELARSIEEHLYSDEPDANDDFTFNILNGITQENVSEILNAYKNIMSVDLLDSIEQRTDIPDDKKLELTQHLHKMIYQQKDTKEGGEELAIDMFEDLTMNNGKNFGQLLNYATRDTLKYILTLYPEIEKIHNEGLDITDENTSQSKYKSILNSILNNQNFTQDEKNNYINQIINLATEGLSDFDKAGVIKDISSNYNNIFNVEIDIMRALNKTGGDFRNENIGQEQKLVSPNGTFDEHTQQGQTGDCWLIAGMNSLICKQGLRDRLEALYKYNPETGGATVELKGINKTYEITKEEFEQSNALSTGDGDMRAFEIAMDKYMKEAAYKQNLYSTHSVSNISDTINDVDINGNHVSTLFFNLFGSDAEISTLTEDVENIDYNDELTAYTFSLKGREELSGLAMDSNTNDVTIIPNHAYSIIGSDTENIYILNPWDSSNTITISRENYAKLGACVESCRLLSPEEIEQKEKELEKMSANFSGMIY